MLASSAVITTTRSGSDSSSMERFAVNVYGWWTFAEGGREALGDETVLMLTRQGMFAESATY